jgi:GT2 family glycosyltransferase
MNQTQPVTNIYVVDAMSTDGTREYVEELIESGHKNIHLIDEPESNVPGSRRAVACNEGLRKVSSKYVGFLDADVEVPPEWSKGCIWYLQFFEKLKIDVAGVTSGCIKNEGTNLSRAISNLIEFGSTHARQFSKTQKVNSLPGYNAIYHTTALREINGFNELIGGCEDWEMNKRLRETGYALLGIPESPVNHKERKDAKSFSKQMRGYGWSRSRLAVVTGTFTTLHSLPVVLSFIIITLLSTIFHTLVMISFEPLNYMLIEILDNFSERLPYPLTFILTAGTMFTAWVIGYVDGLLPQ